MAELKLLAAIRARVAEQSMTLADLARAAGVQPGNLRRMFASTASSPRLGSVMRLLPPLHCRIAPAGARTAAELAAYLDDQRRHQDLNWAQLLDQRDAGADKVAAIFLSESEKLSLPVVMRLADTLHIELSLVDDEVHGVRDGRTKRRPPASPRRPSTRSQTVNPAPPSPPAEPPPAEPPVRAVAPPTPPSIGPLRPPRLGRYRDATPTPQPVRSPPASWTPREQPRPVAADALVPRLVELSSDQWGDVYAFTWGVLTRGATLPRRFIEGLGRMTEGFMARLRGSPAATRPAIPDPPNGWYDSLDPALLVRHWLASRQPEYRSTDILQTYDEHGIRVGHLALDCTTMVAIRLAQHGSPHQLIDLVHLPREGEPKSMLHTVVPLAVKLGDEHKPLRHVKAGPVFGELAAGDHIYLLAAVSSLLVIVEVHGEHSRVVWGGRAEKLPNVVIEPLSPDAAPRIDEPAAIIAELERRLAQTEALLAAERRSREDDRRSDTPHAPGAGQTAVQFASTMHFVTELQTQLSAQAQQCMAAEQKRLIAEARLKKVIITRDNLAAELAALHSGAATRPEDPEATVAELERRLAEAEAQLAAERRAREEDRHRHETRGQEAGQTPQQTENTLRFITELQTRLRTETQERLEAEDKLLIAEDKRVIAEARLKQIAQARDELAAELEALRSAPTAENIALVDAEHRARCAADEAARMTQQLAFSQTQEQTARDALVATQEELDGVRRAQADEMSQIRELLAAKRFPEAVIHSLARSLGESDHKAVLDHFPQPDGDAAPPDVSTDDGPTNTIHTEATPAVVTRPPRARRNIVGAAPPTDYPAFHAAHAVRKTGRNEECPCGSGKKYKKCCGMVAT